MIDMGGYSLLYEALTLNPAPCVICDQRRSMYRPKL